ncbi:ribonuclease activity A regulator [Mycolicibacterium mageritense DSM 44476 = CIP 104973]|uniref:4-hydroxy-4-methyl-2-oxoglutarate aldolase n=1 Tax=Mycolicibacterium mageritense TaxID=53462 RepID=A0AAI8TRU5_MYCME|nr:ribonuclease E activity regulator RraA [Mycolicibacterium mageritense]MBN3458902.1 ribonuclease E activity regulator RraA [Mycobacterium sp. DSM 3803]MCC9183867.1 ribonuclease E activity regulator RraA [Mycolicibacterium mageritense]TXI56188.1 MAG: ribonuclease E activity regulator RraA [Mycolicibacterium mageritense]CDO20677.1 ribonuclease activity regulator protein RraA [Mycolicibacterium mageritense DSM 44476 = CIP 104973]BBX34804.1 putative 4-hydroxy-4-methyl-2-oxoglutarate aldolase [My
MSTSDLYDEHGEALESCDLPLLNYGGVREFSGEIVTFRSREDNLILKDLIAEPGEGRVIVVDTEGVTRCAMLGDNMALTAHRNGWAGLVVNGAVRDVEALAAIPIGIKALGSNPRRSYKAGAGERNVPVTFGGALFTPGEILVSDADGIVVGSAALLG